MSEENRDRQGKIKVIYFSGPLETTKKFIDKLDKDLFTFERIPLRRKEEQLEVNEPYLLFTPTYGAGREEHSVPKQVVNFLRNRPEHLENLKGIVGSGNKLTYGENFVRAAKDLSKLTGAPIVATFELLGTPEEVIEVTEKSKAFWEFLGGEKDEREHKS